MVVFWINMSQITKLSKSPSTYIVATSGCNEINLPAEIHKTVASWPVKEIVASSGCNDLRGIEVATILSIW